MTDPSREALEALHQSERAHDRLKGHEELCGQRWATLTATISEMKASVRRLYSQQWAAASAIIFLLLGIIGYLYARLP